MDNYANKFLVRCKQIKPFSPKSLYNDLAILALLIVFVYSSFRAYLLSITTDEAVTYLVHSSRTYRDILTFNLPVTSNNHLLNTILIKIFTDFLGMSEFVVRIPALIGLALYLIGVWKILNLFLKSHKLVLGICLLTFHPFLIDLFSCARGYSLALGFLALGLYYLFRRIQHFILREDLQDNYIAWIMFAFSVLSHLSFLDAYLSLMAIYGLSEFILFLKRRYSPEINSKNWNYRSVFIPPLISSTLLAIIYTMPIVKMMRAGKEFIGGSQGFWHDTVLSLMDITLYGSVKNVQSTNIILVICEILIIGLIILAFGWLIYATLKKKMFESASIQCFFVVLLFLVICPLQITLQHRLLGRPFPLDRYGIYFILIFALFLLMFWENVDKTEVKLIKILWNACCYMIISIVLAYFVVCWNVSYYYSWRFDANTKKMMNYLAAMNREKQLMDNSVHLGVNWFMEASVNFYKKKNGLRWLARVDPNPDGEFDYYYVTEPNIGLKEKYELRLIKRYNLSNTYLLAWESGAKRNCIENVSLDHWKGEYYDNKALSGAPLRVRDDGAKFINFNWSGGSSGRCGVSSDDFSVRWTRKIYFHRGTYHFTVTGDDGFRLFVDDELKLEKWFDQPPTTYTVEVPLSAGNHTLKMEYYQAGGQSRASLSWKMK